VGSEMGGVAVQRWMVWLCEGGWCVGAEVDGVSVRRWMVWRCGGALMRSHTAALLIIRRFPELPTAEARRHMHRVARNRGNRRTGTSKIDWGAQVLVAQKLREHLALAGAIARELRQALGVDVKMGPRLAAAVVKQASL
jgi:hypothetical protein